MRDLILKEALSVRQVEKLVKKKKASGRSKAKEAEKGHYLQSLADNLRRTLGTKVDIRKRGRAGSIVIYFYSEDELDRLLDLIT